MKCIKVLMRQLEVSIAAKDLKESGWINMRKMPKTGKGRPYNIFSLKINFSEIIDQLEKQQKTLLMGCNPGLSY